MRTLRNMIGCVVAVTAIFSVAPVAAGPNKVTSHLEWPVWGGWYCSGEGTVTGTFVATPVADGSWNVAAKFRPHGVNLTCWSGTPGCCPWNQHLRGVGVAEFNAIPGVPVTVTADGLYWDSGPVEYPAYFAVTVIVGADGIVTSPVVSALADDAPELLTEDPFLGVAETVAHAEEIEDDETSIDVEIASPQAGACEAGSHEAFIFGVDPILAQAKRDAKANAQSSCAENCGALDACPPNKPVCQGSAHVGNLRCVTAGCLGGWCCSGYYRCACSCAGNH